MPRGRGREGGGEEGRGGEGRGEEGASRGGGGGGVKVRWVLGERDDQQSAASISRERRKERKEKRKTLRLFEEGVAVQ